MTTDRMLVAPRQAPLAAVVLGVLGLLGLLGGCSMPSDDQAQVISISEDHLGLLDPAPVPESTSTTVRERTQEVGLYFIEDDKLRRQPSDLAVSRAGNLTSVLNELLQGTLRQNFRSAIPAGVEIIDTRISDSSRTATIVLLDNTLFSIEGSDRLRAIAQMVFTATDRNGNAFGVDRIQFEIDGEVRTIPKGDGTDSNQPVGRCDYESYATADQVRDCANPSTTNGTSSPNGSSFDSATDFGQEKN